MVKLYSNVRKEIRTGDLLIWKTTKIQDIFDLFLFVYQKIFGAKYTHMAIAVVMDGRVLMVEATPPLSRLFPVSSSRDFYHLPANIPSNDNHVEFLLSLLNRKYSVIGFLRTKFKLYRSVTAEDCSELASEFYNNIGYIDNEDAGLTPDTLVAAVRKASGAEPVFIKIDRGNL